MSRTATPNAAAQFETRGYVINEDGDWILRDAAEGLIGFALLCEEREGDLPEISKEQLAGILRTFSRAVSGVIADAPFTNRATARKRSAP